MSILNPTDYNHNNILDFDFIKIPEYTKEQYNNLINKIIMEYLHPENDIIYGYLRYTLEHKIAIMALSYEYLGYVSKRIILHDIEKLILYTLIDKKEASKLHRQYSIHHHGNFNLYGNEIGNRTEAILDYECSRYTKPDKQRNAYCTIEYHCPKDMADASVILNNFGINDPINHDLTFDKWNRVASIYMPVFESEVIKSIKELKTKFTKDDIHTQIELFNINLSKYKV